MAEERDRDHKRVRQACANCRRKKTRCSGERPVCAFCARLGQSCRYTEDFNYPESTVPPYPGPSPQENHRLAARVALLESRLSLLDANGVEPVAAFSFGSSPGRPSTSGTQQNIASPHNLIDGDFASLLDPATLQSLAEVYFQYCHKQPYTYFHEGTFRASLENGSLPSYLIFAFAATAVRYSSEPCFAGHQAEAMDSYSRLAWADIMEQSFSDTHSLSISTVQAANMLGIVDYVAGRNQVAWVKIGLAVRLAQTLQLGKEPQPWLLPSEAEERRHTFWSVYLLDKLVACGRDRPPVLLDADCTVRLPVDPCSFQNNMGAEPPTLAAIQEIPDVAPLEKSDHFALSIFMVSILGYIARWGFKHSAPETRLPWDSRSEFSRINGILLSFETYSDACDGSFANTLDRHFVSHGVLDESISTHFTYCHVIYHVNQCLLHHPFLLRQHLQSFKANVPAGFLRAAMLKSREHATRIATILHALQDRGCETYPSFYGYAAIIAGVILQLHYVSPTSLRTDELKENWESCLRFLEHKPVRWPSYRRMGKILRDFEPSPLLASDLLSSNFDRTPLEPESEDALWQMCDYSWLASSARLTPITQQVSPSGSDSPGPDAGLVPRTGRTPDFDTLLEGALSFDYSLLNNSQTDAFSNVAFGY